MVRLLLDKGANMEAADNVGAALLFHLGKWAEDHLRAAPQLPGLCSPNPMCDKS